MLRTAGELYGLWLIDWMFDVSSFKSYYSVRKQLAPLRPPSMFSPSQAPYL